jgi:hypothetical protein
MNRLDKILHDWVEKNYPSINADTEGSEEKAMELKRQIEDTLRQQVISEITQEKVKEMVATADEQIRKAARIKKIKEIKELAVQGFIIAFFVGLLVNQVTEIVSFFKTHYNLTNIWYTVLISSGLAFVCFLLCMITFVRNMVEIINENKED